MGWMIKTEHATIREGDTWVAGPRLQALLDADWEPFHVEDMDAANNQSVGKLACPLVWLKKEK